MSAVIRGFVRLRLKEQRPWTSAGSTRTIKRIPPGGQPRLDPGARGEGPGLPAGGQGVFAAGERVPGFLPHPSSRPHLAAPSASGRGNIYFYYELRGRAARNLVIKLSQPNSAENLDIQVGVLIASCFSNQMPRGTLWGRMSQAGLRQAASLFTCPGQQLGSEAQRWRDGARGPGEEPRTHGARS